MAVYNNLLVIGNGFDLNLGLKTSYKDFISSKEFLPLRQSRNRIAETLFNQIKAADWIDIENELKRYSEDYTIPAHMEKDFEGLREALVNYLKTIDVSSMNKESKAYELLSTVAGTECIILDFNYTSSTKFIMQKCGVGASDISKRLIKVHGSIEENNIIFGVEDAAEINREHIYLKKSSNTNFNGFDITDFLQPHTKLHIFGHSLGETDRTYFQPYFDKVLNGIRWETKSDTKSVVDLYHYGRPSWNKLQAQMDSMTSNQLNIYKQRIELKAIDTFV